MIKFHTINNLSSAELSISSNNNELAKQIAELVDKSMTYSNSDTYSQVEFEKLKQNKNAESMLDLINRAFVIYLTDEVNDIIGCGMVVKQDNRYFSKTLHIRPDYRGLGYAQQICDLREDFLKSLGEKEIYIESLKYPKTIAFHKKRGFYDIPPYRDLKNTVLMKKDLIQY